MARRVPDTAARAIRGGGQGSVAYAIDVLITSFAHLTNDQFGAILVLLTVVVTAAQNYAENSGWIPALLKDVDPKPPRVPVVDEIPDPPKRTATKRTTSSGHRKSSG